MTKQEFKKRWESSGEGSGITYNDIAICAIEWGISPRPRTRPLDEIRSLVLAAAGIEEEA